MPRSLTPRLGRFATYFLLACFALLPAFSPARAQETTDPETRLAREQDLSVQRAAFHKLHHALLMQGARAKLREGRERAELVRKARRGDAAARRALRMRKPADEEGPIPPDMLVGSRPGALPTASEATNLIPTNVRCNNPAGDAASSGQSEESVATLGDNVVVAWNDGQTFVTGGDGQGYAWSNNGGVTFTDGGDILHPAGFALWKWSSDPVMTVNEKTGEFWYCGLADADASHNAIGVARGKFTAGVFAWDTAIVVRNVSNSSFFLDKQWIAADSSTGNVYLSNTTFTLTGDQIDFQRSTDGGRSWSVATTISDPSDEGYVQGSRPAVGPNGELYVVWQAIEKVTDFDHFRFRKSVDAGASFGTEVTAADYVSNFGTGAPGFNRERGITFPSIAVDRTFGAHRGRVYLAWNETWDWWDDGFPAITAGNAKSESDVAGNNTSNSSTATANAATIGQVLRGNLQTTSNVSDNDYFAIPLTAGDRILVYSDSFTAGRAFVIRLYAPSPDGAQRLCYGGKTDSLNASITSLVWNFMAPSTGTYFLRVTALSRRTNTYRIRTTYGVRASERGRDQRDAFVSSSDDGTTWSTPTMLNDTAMGFDEFLPEVGVAADGMPYALWFDERDDTYGSRTHVYATRSDNGGNTWAGNQRITSAQSNFTTAPTNIAPNMGDYSHMAASTTRLHPVWSDGRATNPSVDVFSTAVLTTSSIQSCPNDTTMSPSGTAAFGWTLANDNPLFAGNYGVTVTSQRAWSSTGYPSVVIPSFSTAFYQAGITVPDTAANGPNSVCLTFTTPGGVVVGQCCFDITVTGSALAVGDHLSGFALAPSWPNPAPGHARIAYSLPRAGHVKLNVYDISGARVRRLLDESRNAGPASIEWDGHDDRGNIARAGAYFYRLEFEGQFLTQRMVLVK